MEKNNIVKEQLLHMVVGTLIFFVLAFFAVSLDLASSSVAKLGVSAFTVNLLEMTAHGLMVVDLILFVVYLGTSSYQLIKEMFK